MRATVRLALFFALALGPCAGAAAEWTEAQIRVLRSLSLSALPSPPAVPSNRVADNPAAARLGARLFFDPRLSANGELSCASCHQPERHFSDGLPVGVGVGKLKRHTPTLDSVAWQSWFYWDGRRDSLWSQALVPIEAPLELGGSRLGTVRVVATDEQYRRQYEAVFGRFPARLQDASLPAHASPVGSAPMRDAWAGLPDPVQRLINRVYANLGKAIAAYERTLRPGETAFDRYVAALLSDGETAAAAHMSQAAIAGAALFIDAAKTQCLQCHNGPLLTNGGFHNIGTGRFSGTDLDYGRALGAQAVLVDEFNCLGDYSDADADECSGLRFMPRDNHSTMAGAFKTPTLRNVALTGPYMHDGRFHTLGRVLRHYLSPPPLGENGHHELRPLALSDEETGQLAAFLEALSVQTPAPAGHAAAAPATGRAATETERAASPAQMPPAADVLRAFTASERQQVSALSLSRLPAAPADPGNAAFDSASAIELGRALFNDPGLSGSGALTCAGCHPAGSGASDAAVATDSDDRRRDAPALTGVAHRRWLYRDGRKDSLWSQALGAIEAPLEMGGSRLAALRHVFTTPSLRDLYARTFGAPPALDFAALPRTASPLGAPEQQRAWAQIDSREQQKITRGFTALGKALAAYERTLRHAPSRFDAWLSGARGARLDDDEIAGLKLFVSGRAKCVRCHSGPLLSDGAFHSIGTGTDDEGRVDRGREGGIALLAADPFNCLSEFSDAVPPADCEHLRALNEGADRQRLRGAFRTPGLRGLAASAPYMHDGRFASLAQVVAFYAADALVASTPGEDDSAAMLDRREQQQLVRFLLTL